jgi:hypothetical protein
MIDLLNILREYNEDQRPYKILRQFSQDKHINDYDLQVYLEIYGHMISHVIVNFGSQVNIFPQDTWIKLGRYFLTPTMDYLKF